MIIEDEKKYLSIIRKENVGSSLLPLRDWEIALIVIGCLLIILLIIAGIVLCFCFGLLCFDRNEKRKLRRKSKASYHSSSSKSSVKSQRPKPIIHYVDIDDVDRKPSINGYNGSPKPKPRRYEAIKPKVVKKEPDANYAPDDVKQYSEEGHGSDAGSLSSIVSSEGSQSEVETHMSNILARMGDRFSVLARLYSEDKEESSSVSDTSSDSTIVPAPGSESWV